MKQDKKDKKEKKVIKHVAMPDNEEDLAKFLSEIDQSKTRVHIIGFTINIVNNPWLNMLIYLVMNTLFITASFCIFQPVTFNTYWFLPVFIILFTIFDYLFKFIIYRYLQKFILYTVTLIFAVGNIIALAIASIPMIFFFEIGVVNIFRLIGSILVFLLIRFIVTYILKRKKV